MNVEVVRYRKPNGYLTRYWAVMVNGELLAVILYRKGAEAVAQMIASPVLNDRNESKSENPKQQKRYS